MSMLATIRFLVGAGLVAAGASLVAPLATKLVVAARPLASGSGEIHPGLPARSVDPSPAVATVAAPPPSAVPPQAAWGMGPEPAWATDAGPAPPDSTGGLQLDRCPPPPPAPLPPAPHELVQAAPAIGAAYRSTLDVPPPPLLDAAGPPPSAMTWATPGVPAGGGDVASRLAAPVVADATVPPTYRVVDGDDLVTIAGRFYGHPAAAPAIWAANRDTIADPEILPIGVELRLPRPWAVRGHGRTMAGAIEPVAYARPVAAPQGAPPLAPAAAPWLEPAGAMPVPPAAASRAPAAPAAHAVTVGPGETLESLARRLYGDPGMAAALFAANRDRLRSPDLVVPGMELRLPRPVSAPRS